MTDPKDRPRFEDLYSRARQALADGAYRPGDRIGVKDLAARLATSTTPAREILSRLVGLGVVEEHRAEGYYLRALDERQVAALYRLHARCVDEAAGMGTAPPHLAEGLDPWTVFDLLVEATGDIVLLDLRRHLDARLSLLRRPEARLFADLPAEAERIGQSLRDADPSVRRKAVRAFHHRRSGAARQLAFLLGRHRDMDQI